MENEKINLLQKLIQDANNIVFFGGAGTSTDCGIKDFRSKDGLYQMKWKYPVEEMLSSNMFYQNTEEFYSFYQKYMDCRNIEPNILHYFLKDLEQAGKLKAIITQNIDGLHEKAGSKKVYEIHGSIYHNHCLSCNHFYHADTVFSAKGIPRCQKCGGIIKPDVVLYGEMLPEKAYLGAIEAIQKADLLIVAGTSLSVEPAASFISFFPGKNLVIINNEKTKYDEKANLVIHENLKKVFENLTQN